MKMASKVLIVGCGLTGSTIASCLRQKLGAASKKVEISIWEKGQKMGGRMNTFQSKANEAYSLDLAAQYISQMEHDKEGHKMFYKNLLDANIIKPLSQSFIDDKHFKGITNFYAVNGMCSIVEHFAKEADANVVLNRWVISVNEKEGGGKYLVQATDGTKEEFDAVVLTMPVPRITPLHVIRGMELRDTLSKVEYSERWAMGMFFKPGATLDVPWTGKYFWDDLCVRFVCIDNKKRQCDDHPMSLVVHTNVPFGMRTAKSTNAEAQDLIMKYLKKVLPELHDEPIETIVQRYRFSQIVRSVDKSPGFISIRDRPTLLLSGDAFSRGNFDGCIDAAIQTSNHLYKLLA